MDKVNANALACVTSQTTLAIARRRRQGEFLRAYRESVGSSDSAICKMIHINPKLLSRWKNEDPLFKIKYLEAQEEVRLKKIEILEQELYRRAVEGVETPLVSMGKVVTTVQKYSDTLLQAALKAELPSKYEKKDKGLAIEIGEEGGKFIKAYVGFNPDDV
jgi:hypothetical protein